MNHLFRHNRSAECSALSRLWKPAALLLAAGFALTTQAQTLYVHQSPVTVAVPSADAGDMTYGDDGTTLTILGATYNVADIDSITFDRNDVEEATVAVTYNGSEATLLVSADIYPYLTITVADADVSIIASADLATEVTYALSGTSSDGSFYMDGEYKATLQLSDLTLTNTRGGAITIDCGKRIDVVIPDGTTTTLADGDGSQKACFFINGHAEFKKGGTLNLVGNLKHAYASDEYTLFKSSFGTLNITSSANDGLHIDQYFQIDGGTINISGVAGDCIDISATDDEDDELNGQAIINAGTINLDITADDTKGIKTENEASIYGGSLTANVAGDGCKGISTGTDLLIDQTDDATPTTVTMYVSGSTYMAGDEDLESKCRGIKVKGDFTFAGGTIYMEVTGSKAKGISVDGTYTYTGGTTNTVPS